MVNGTVTYCNTWSLFKSSFKPPCCSLHLLHATPPHLRTLSTALCCSESTFTPTLGLLSPPPQGCQVPPPFYTRWNRNCTIYSSRGGGRASLWTWVWEQELSCYNSGKGRLLFFPHWDVLKLSLQWPIPAIVFFCCFTAHPKTCLLIWRGRGRERGNINGLPATHARPGDRPRDVYVYGMTFHPIEPPSQGIFFYFYGQKIRSSFASTYSFHYLKSIWWETLGYSGFLDLEHSPQPPPELVLQVGHSSGQRAGPPAGWGPVPRDTRDLQCVKNECWDHSINRMTWGACGPLHQGPLKTPP